MLEKKYTPLEDLDIRLKDDKAGVGRFEGYASTFGNTDSYGDIIEPGAFKGSLKSGRRVLMLDSHNPTAPIGVWKDLHEDKKGLYVQGEFTPGHSRAEDVYAALKHGSVTGMSIGFRVPKGGAVIEEDDEGERRILKTIDLVEISVVAMPANELAQVSAVKAEISVAINEMETKRDAERILRDAGLSKSAAMAFVGRAWRIARSESESDGLGEIKRILGKAVTRTELEAVLTRL